VPGRSSQSGSRHWQHSVRNREEMPSTIKERRRIVIAYDGDSDGQKGAQKAATFLSRAHLPVLIADIPDGKDVSDVLREENGQAKFEAIVEAAVPFTISTSSDAVLAAPAIIVTGSRTVLLGTRMSDVQPENIDWLWKGRIPLGKIIMLDGMPEQGKSTVSDDLAARVSKGLEMPDSTPGPKGSVVIVTTEDGISDTILPRLEAAGADLERCIVIDSIQTEEGSQRPFLLPDDIRRLEEIVKSEDVRLLIIDPLFAHLNPNVNPYSDQDIRGALWPLAVFAERHRLAVVLIRHYTKNIKLNAMLRGGGSIGIIGAARAGFVIGTDPQNPTVRVLACTKMNLGPKPVSLSFKLAPSPSNPSVAVVQWTGESDLTADELSHGMRPDVQAKLQQAISFLKDDLASGPRRSDEVIEHGMSSGFSETTLRRALKVIGEAIKTGFGTDGYWAWRLKDDGAA